MLGLSDYCQVQGAEGEGEGWDLFEGGWGAVLALLLGNAEGCFPKLLRCSALPHGRAEQSKVGRKFL